MSINACTINTNSIDGFCGNIRAKVLARLIEEKNGVVTPPTGGGGGGGSWAGGPGFQVPPIHNPYPFGNLQPHNPYVTVTADLFGYKGQQTLNKDAPDVFVTARNVDIQDTEISVTMRNMDIQDADEITVSARNMDIQDVDSIRISIRNLDFKERDDDEDITVNIQDLEID